MLSPYIIILHYFVSNSLILVNNTSISLVCDTTLVCNFVWLSCNSLNSFNLALLLLPPLPANLSISLLNTIILKANSLLCVRYLYNYCSFVLNRCSYPSISPRMFNICLYIIMIYLPIMLDIDLILMHVDDNLITFLNICLLIL